MVFMKKLKQSNNQRVNVIKANTKMLILKRFTQESNFKLIYFEVLVRLN